MPSKYEVEIVIIGAGSNRVGLWLLGLVAKVFHISLEVCPTPLAPDACPYCLGKGKEPANGVLVRCRFCAGTGKRG